MRDLDLSSDVIRIKNKKRKLLDNRTASLPIPKVFTKNNGTGTIDPVPCDSCGGLICTTNICRHPQGNRKISDEDGWICGLETCIECMEKNNSENRVVVLTMIQVIHR